MTVASTFAPQHADPAAADSRRQEPSMEDILASIRRIIADDQTQGVRSGYGEPEAGSSSAVQAQPESDRAVGSASVVVERSGQGSRTQYEDVFDLAGVPGASLPETTLAGYDEPGLVASESEPRVAQESDEDRSGASSGNYGSVQEGGVASPDPSFEIRNGQPPQPRFRASGSDEGFAQVTHQVPQAPVFRGDQQENTAPHAEEVAEDTGDALISPILGASVMSAFETLAATVMLQNTDMLERIMRELLRPMVKVWLDENLPTLVERLVRGEIERVARGGRG